MKDNIFLKKKKSKKENKKRPLIATKNSPMKTI